MSTDGSPFNADGQAQLGDFTRTNSESDHGGGSDRRSSASIDNQAVLTTEWDDTTSADAPSDDSDPEVVTDQDTWFTPGNLDRADIEAEIVDNFAAQPLHTLERPSIDGCGVYALYYHGDHPLYTEISSPRREASQPIYVGKASPPGGRKGVTDLDYEAPKLAERLTDHYESIQEAQNLRTSDFSYAYLHLKKPWIRVAEELLISRYLPWWNRYITGLGNHDVGAGRSGSAQSLWDMFHPGREFVVKRGLVPRGNPGTVWREEVKPAIREDGRYETIQFPGTDLDPFDPRENTDAFGVADLNRF